MLKQSASFVLGSSKSSTYPRGYASGFDSPAALLDELFEHPAGTVSCCATRADCRSPRVQHYFMVACQLMQLRIDYAQPDDAPIIAQMVGELLREIMAAIGTQAFGFYQEETDARARSWMTDGKYRVVLARDVDRGEPLGFLALYECYALYAEGPFGTIPELFVRPAYRSSGVGATLISEAQGVGQAKGWRRIEVTTPPLPQFDRTLAFYQQQGFNVSGGRKLKIDL